MSRSLTFITGMIAGTSLVSVAANAFEPGWVTAANNVVDRHVDVRFTQAAPPDPCVPPDPCRIVGVNVAPTLDATTIVTGHVTPPDPNVPPDPCFRAVFVTPPDPDRPAPVTLQVLHPDQLRLVGPDGQPATLCSGIAIDGGPR